MRDLPIGVKSIKEVLDGLVDAIGENLPVVELDDCLGHQRYSVQMSSSDYVQTFVESLQAFARSTFIFESNEVSEKTKNSAENIFRFK